jgi:hypothetical protein
MLFVGDGRTTINTWATFAQIHGAGGMGYNSSLPDATTEGVTVTDNALPPEQVVAALAQPSMSEGVPVGVNAPVVQDYVQQGTQPSTVPVQNIVNQTPGASVTSFPVQAASNFPWGWLALGVAAYFVIRGVSK